MTESPTPYVLDADTMTGGMRPIRQAVLTIGSNLGDRLNQLQGGIAALEDTPEVTVVAISSVYETEPVDAPENSSKFLNAVVLIDTTLTVHTL
ncbi:MAG: 2-amino-4-hydroxy-6-hydroxymethyldihydropteridine diphosphokinase, partial [Aeromicrobium sp.]